MSKQYEQLVSRLREAAVLGSVANLLAWDQETMMPPQAADFRAEELSMLSRLAHERLTASRVGELLEACEKDTHLASDARVAANIREMRRDFDRRRKLPSSLVAEMSEVNSRAMVAWKEARANSDFAAFQPWLERQLELNRRKAECYGAPEGGEAYDALLEDFEPGMRGSELEAIFGPLRSDLSELIAEIADSTYLPDQAAHDVEIPTGRQIELNRWILGRLGFRENAGRLDVSTHPFSSGVAPGDTRLTTRYTENQFAEALSSTMHEAGHALYEQGLPLPEHHGQPLGEAVSLGIHESQSRLWENHVGRSRAFWDWALTEVATRLGPELERFSVDDMFEAVNTVRPKLIRVESDEATYNLHVMLRFNLERAMIRGDLAPADLPAAWNEHMKRDLGLDVPDDARGCLQDIHWSMGCFGYFPTYTLGSLYAAQLWEALGTAIPDIDAQVARGEFVELLAWLRENIHAHGRRFAAADLCLLATGDALSHAPLLRHLNGKLRGIYRLGRSWV